MMRILLVFFLFLCAELHAQDSLSVFHKERREALRELMPKNSVCIFFSAPVRNRSNDVDYPFHQDPNFYYLTGYTEPHAVFLLFKEPQKIGGKTSNEILYVKSYPPIEEVYNGKALSASEVKQKFGIAQVLNVQKLKNLHIDFSRFDQVFLLKFENGCERY